MADYIALRYDKDNIVLAPPGKTHEEMIDIAEEAFPEFLANVGRRQISFACASVEKIVYQSLPVVGPTAWPIVASQLVRGNTIQLKIKPEGGEGDRALPPYTEHEPEPGNLVIFELGPQHAAFVFPGKSFEEGVQIAKATFPNQILDIPSNRFTFSMTFANGVKCRILPSVYKPVLSSAPSFGRFSIIHVAIKPEAPIKRP